MRRTTERVNLGNWHFPSGNRCDVTYERDVRGVGHLIVAWDFPPPLRPDDSAYYHDVVVPALIRCGLRLHGGK